MKKLLLGLFGVCTTIFLQAQLPSFSKAMQSDDERASALLGELQNELYFVTESWTSPFGVRYLYQYN